MDESLLWAVALGAGVVGLLLLAVAVVVAIALNIRTNIRTDVEARSAKGVAATENPQSYVEDVASPDGPQSHADDVSPTDGPRSHVDGPDAESVLAGGFWTWLKAWIFALVHAGTVSVVFGGITFFEDLAKAGDEIQRTGTVTFPKQLLPGPLAESMYRRRLERPSDGPSERLEKLDQGSVSPSDASGWEVVERLEEADTDDDG